MPMVATGAVVTRVVKQAGHAAAGVCSAAAVAGLGMPALGAVVFLAVLVIAVACWVINCPDRTDRVSRLLLARRGDSTCLAPGPAVGHSVSSGEGVADRRESLTATEIRAMPPGKAGGALSRLVVQ